MQHKDVAVKQVGVRGRGAKQNRFLAQESGARVLHAAVGKTGDQDHVVLQKWKRLGEEVRQVLDAARRDLLDGRRFGERALILKLANVERRLRSCFDRAKRASGEGEKICADWASFFEP